MANVEGEHPDPDHLDLTDEDLIPADPSTESVADDADLLSEADQEEAVEEPKKKKEKKRRKKKREKAKKPDKKKVENRDKTEGWGLREAITTADVFTVMLGLALLAVLIAVFCLLMELKAYDFDIKAEEAKRQITAAPAAQTAPATRTVAVWPIDVRLTNSAAGAEGASGSPRIT